MSGTTFELTNGRGTTHVRNRVRGGDQQRFKELCTYGCGHGVHGNLQFSDLSLAIRTVVTGIVRTRGTN